MTLRLSVFPFSIASFLSICHFCTFDFLSMSILKFNTSPTYFSPSALPHYSSSPIFPFSLIFFLPPYPLPFSPIPLTPTSPSVFRHDLIHSSTIFPPPWFPLPLVLALPPLHLFPFPTLFDHPFPIYVFIPFLQHQLSPLFFPCWSQSLSSLTLFFCQNVLYFFLFLSSLIPSYPDSLFP